MHEIDVVTSSVTDAPPACRVFISGSKTTRLRRAGLDGPALCNRPYERLPAAAAAMRSPQRHRNRHRGRLFDAPSGAAWIEHSRSTNGPWFRTVPSSWISIGRGRASRRSMYTAVSPKADPASDRAVAIATARASADSTARIPSPPAGDSLDHERNRCVRGAGELFGGGGRRKRGTVPGTTGTPARSAAPAPRSCCHEVNRLWRGPMKSAGRGAGSGEACILRGTVAGMNSIGAAHGGGRRLLRCSGNSPGLVRTDVDPDRLRERAAHRGRSPSRRPPPQSHLPAGADDADGDLAAVGDEHRHNGMFPCFFGGFRSRFVSSPASAAISLARVWRGRITSSTNPRDAAT